MVQPIDLPNRPDPFRFSNIPEPHRFADIPEPFHFQGAPQALSTPGSQVSAPPPPPPPPPVPSFTNNTYSVAFDGTNDYVSAGATGDTYYDIGTNDFSFSFWLKLDAIAGTFTGVFGTSGSSTGYQAYMQSNGNLAFYNAPTLYQNLSSALSTGQWYHIAYVRNSGSLTVYVNGTAGSSVSVGSLTFESGTDFRIGDDPNAIFPPINGLIDEFAFWKNYALTTSEISNIRGGVPAGTSGAPVDISSIGTDNSGNTGPDNWWRMGDNDGGTGTTITDQGSGGKNGTLTNGPTFSTDVPIFSKYSVDFDGSDDYVEVGNVSGLTGTSFSISAWFYLTANPSGEGIFGAGSSHGDRIWLQVLDSDTIRFGSLTNVNTFDLSSGTFLLNTWYHVVGVINGTSKEVFINGSSLGSATVYNISGTNGNSVRIGGLPSQTAAFGGLNPYQGKLDEVAVFNTALSSSDVSSIYNSGVPNDISSLNPVGWWRMGDDDSGTGTTITDQGSGGNDGTLTNGPTFSTTVPS